MKLLVVLCLVSVAVAAPPRYNVNDVQILKHENDIDVPRGYRYGFEQSDGTRAEQRGTLKNEGKEDEYVAVEGSFSWVGPDGVTYTINYTADENGYQPEISQGPGGGVPPAVVASLLG